MNKKIIPLFAVLSLLTSCNKNPSTSSGSISTPSSQVSEITPTPTPTPEPDPSPEVVGNAKTLATRSVTTSESDGTEVTWLSIIGVKNKNITKMIIPSSIDGVEIRRIEKGAFSGCKNLQEIYIPETVNAIERYTSTTSDTDVNDINEYSPFTNLENLSKIEVSENNKFYKVIGNCLLENSTTGESRDDNIVCGWGKVDISSLDIAQLPASCFRKCTSITSITLPHTIDNIGRFAICELPKLGYCEIEDDLNNPSIYKVQNNCLYSATQIVCGWGNVTVPDEVTNISDYSFFKNLTLNNVNTNNHVLEIWPFAFAYSTLSVLHISSSVTQIYKTAFDCVETLKDIEIDSDNTFFNIPIEDGVKTNFLMKNEDSNTLIVGWGDAIIPSNKPSLFPNDFSSMWSISSLKMNHLISTLPDDCFKGSHIKELYITPSLSLINSGALYNLQNLEKITVDENNRYFKVENNCLIDKSTNNVIVTAGGDITIPSGVQAIQEGAIPCNIHSLTLNNDLVELKNGIFQEGVTIESLHIPASVSKMTGFGLDSSPSINALGIKTITVDSKNEYFYVKGNALIEKATASGDSEKTLLIWGDYTVSEPSEVIAGYLNGCASITSLTISNKITTLNYFMAFNGLDSLKEIKYLGTKDEFVSACGTNQYNLIDTYPNVLITFSDSSTYLLAELKTYPY